MRVIGMVHHDAPETLRPTHHCAVGDQPRLKFVAVDKADLIPFAFDRVSKIQINNNRHLRTAKTKARDKNSFDLESELWPGGKHSLTTFFTTSRKDR